MALAVCVFIGWSVILILSLIPKTLTEIEMVFVFLTTTVFELSVFTVIHLNLHWVEVSTSVEKSLADLVMRLICIPTMLVITSNALFYSSKFLKWSIIAAVVLVGIMLQKIMEWLGILTTPHWNVGYTILKFCSSIAFTGLMTWFITYIKRVEGKIT